MEKKKNLSMALRDEADDLGLCSAWHRAWHDDSTQQELIDKYLKGIDFCLMHHWPTAGFIRKHFDVDILRRNGVLVNDRYSIRNKPEIVISGNSDAIVRLDGDCSSRIYVGDDSKARVFVKTAEKVIVEVRDRASVEIVPDPYYFVDVCVYVYSDEASVEAPAGIRCVREEDYLV